MKNIKKDTNNCTINWLKIKVFWYSKNMPGIIQFKYSHSESFRYLNTRGKSRPTNYSSSLKQIYYP